MPEPPELPPAADLPLSVILPVRDADEVLDEVVHAWTAYLGAVRKDAYEFVIVNDGSSDRSAEIGELLGMENPRVRVLHRPAPGGVGAALRDGLAAATLPLVFLADCDKAYQPADLKLFLDVIDHVHVACGVREGWRDGFLHHWYLRWAFGIRLKDVACPLKLFRREVFARIPIQSDGDFAHAEIVAKANFLGCMLTEVPLPTRAATRRGLPPSPARQNRKEARRVFHRPDFGPADLSPPAPPEPGESV